MASTKRTALLAGILLALLAALALFSLTVGVRDISLAGVLHALQAGSSQDPSDLVVWTLRLPRLLAALVCGLSFAVAGALMQGVTNNPLASPSILGINAGASFGLALAMIVLPAASLQVTIISAFFGAALATAFILVLASLKHGLRLSTLPWRARRSARYSWPSRRCSSSSLTLHRNSATGRPAALAGSGWPRFWASCHGPSWDSSLPYRSPAR